jgi:hypothetical protein
MISSAIWVDDTRVHRTSSVAHHRHNALAVGHACRLALATLTVLVG